MRVPRRTPSPAAPAVATYIPLTFVVTEWRGKVRKQMNALDNEKEGKATDMLLVGGAGGRVGGGLEGGLESAGGSFCGCGWLRECWVGCAG